MKGHYWKGKVQAAPKGYQFVTWFPHTWGGFWFMRYDPAKTDWAYVYDWRLMLGFWEVRKWSTHKLPRP